MIRKIIFDKNSEGYAYECGLFRNFGNEIKLKKSVNVLFGNNGCGKSTLLEMIADYTTSPIEGGWYRMPHSLKGKKIYKPGIAGKIDIEWDGCPTYYKDCTKFREILTHKTGHKLFFDEKIVGTSRGESTRNHFDEILDSMKSVPDIGKIKEEYASKEANKKLSKWKEYILSRGPPEGLAYLLDEPDAHLSFLEEGGLWNGLVMFSKENNAQIIAASHSPIVLFHPGVSLIEFSKGYADECRNLFEKLIELKNR